MWRLVLFLLTLTTPTLARDIYIRDNPGGEIHQFAADIAQSVAHGDRAVLSGHVFSAATMWAGHPNACAMRGTTLGFHRGTIIATGGPTTQADDQFYISHHPVALQRFIATRGLTRDPDPSHVYTISTPQLWSFIPPCGRIRTTRYVSHRRSRHRYYNRRVGYRARSVVYKAKMVKKEKDVFLNWRYSL